MGEQSLSGWTKSTSRIAGALYLWIMGSGVFAEAVVRGRIIAPGDGTQTVQNLIASPDLWRIGMAVDLSTSLCDIALAVLLYQLLAPYARRTAMLAAAFRLAYSAAMIALFVLLAAPLVLLRSTSALPPPVLGALVQSAARLHEQGFEAALVVFGVHLVLLGIGIARTRAMPRWLGGALAIAGASYVANSMLDFLAPALGTQVGPLLLLPGFVAEGSLTLLLLIGAWPGSKSAAAGSATAL